MAARSGSRRSAETRVETRDRLLVAIMPHVAFDGWTSRALAAGAADIGMDAVDAERFFPGGVAEIVGHLGDWTDRQMVAALARQDLAALKIRERIALAVRLRLEALAPWRESVRRTVVWLALPPNAPQAARGLWHAVDSIWLAIGDRSADFSFYTKRALLAGVLSTTVLYWLDDRSEDSAETWAFLDRRIADVMQISSLKAKLGRLSESVPDPLRMFRRLRQRAG